MILPLFWSPFFWCFFFDVGGRRGGSPSWVSRVRHTHAWSPPAGGADFASVFLVQCRPANSVLLLSPRFYGWGCHSARWEAAALLLVLFVARPSASSFPLASPPSPDTHSMSCRIPKEQRRCTIFLCDVAPLLRARERLGLGLRPLTMRANQCTHCRRISVGASGSIIASDLVVLGTTIR